MAVFIPGSVQPGKQQPSALLGSSGSIPNGRLAQRPVASYANRGTLFLVTDATPFAYTLYFSDGTNWVEVAFLVAQGTGITFSGGPLCTINLTTPVDPSLGGTGTATAAANTILAGPASGSAAAPAFRVKAFADDPATSNFFFGDGSDGNTTLTTTLTFSRDMFYQNLTIQSGGKIITSGFRLFVNGTLDLTAAPAASITCNGTSGADASGNTAGTAGTISPVGSISGSGTIGSVGGTGNNNSASVAANAAGNNGGIGGVGGSSGIPKTGGTVGPITAYPIRKFQDYLVGKLAGVGTVLGVFGGLGGSGGGGGTTSVAAGGGGSPGGGIVYLSAAVISRGGSTTAAAIQARGAAGTKGASTAIAADAGGGGGGGGGGGWIYLCYGTLTGSTGTNILDASGGAGGDGGDGGSGGQGGDGGSSGAGGRITVINLGAGTSTETTGSGSVTPTAHSGATHGSGAGINTFQVNL